MNLVVGKNNSGKTSFLEAVLAVCDTERAPQLSERLRQNEKPANETTFQSWVLGKGHQKSTSIEAQVGAVPRRVRLYREGRDARYVQEEKGPINSAGHRLPPSISCCVVSVAHRQPDSLVKLVGDALRVKDGEEIIEECLHEIDPRVRRIRIDPYKEGNRIVVDSGLEEMVPLSNLGQGVYRLVEILAEVIGSGASICIVDEIENGIYHAALVDVWKGLVKAASLFGVQVFATTHSAECLRAAHEVFDATKEYDFAVVQLFRTSESRGRVLERESIAAAFRGDIDLRGT